MMENRIRHAKGPVNTNLSVSSMVWHVIFLLQPTVKCGPFPMHSSPTWACLTFSWLSSTASLTTSTWGTGSGSLAASIAQSTTSLPLSLWLPVFLTSRQCPLTGKNKKVYLILLGIFLAKNKDDIFRNIAFPKKWNCVLSCALCCSFVD